MKFKYLFGIVGLGIVSMTSIHAVVSTKLPPKKPKSSEKQLGESDAVKEVQKLIEDSKTRTETSGAVAPVVISGGASSALVNQKKEDEKKLEEPVKSQKAVVPSHQTAQSSKTTAKVEEASVSDPPNSRRWLILDKKPELGFMSGWVFMRKELATLVGGGVSYGFLLSQEVQHGIQAQLRLGASHHHEKNDTRDSSLNLFPFEVMAQFSKELGNLRFYLQPGLGSALWFSKSERIVDGYLQKSHGYDFMASAGIGAQYLIPEQPWRFGADASLSYVSGYFDNYFVRILVYTSYQF